MDGGGGGYGHAASFAAVPQCLRFLVVTIITSGLIVIARTCKIPLLRFKIPEVFTRINDGEVEHRIIGLTPRHKAELTVLNVEWKPGDVDVAVSHRPFEPRIPLTTAVIVNPHVLRQWRDFVFVNTLCTYMKQYNTSHPQSHLG